MSIASSKSIINLFPAAQDSQGTLPRPDVESRVLEVVKKFDKIDASKVTPTSNFNKDLGIDSLDAVELVMVSSPLSH